MNEKRLEQITVQTHRAPQYLYVQHLLTHLILTTILVWVLTFHMRNVSRRWVTHWPEMTQPTSACVRDQSLQSFSNSLQPCGMQPVRRLCPWDSPGTNTGVGCHGLLQGIFPTRRSNLRPLQLLHCRHILYSGAQFKPKQCGSRISALSQHIVLPLLLSERKKNTPETNIKV